MASMLKFHPKFMKWTSMYTAISGNKIILCAQHYPDNQNKAHEKKSFSYGHRTKMVHDILAKQMSKTEVCYTLWPSGIYQRNTR